MNFSPLVEMSHITQRFGAIVALDDVSIDFRPGEVHSIVGENGAGKSTLVKILAGIHTRHQGTIAIKGQPVKFSGPRDALQKGIGCVYQERNLVPNLSVAENIFLGRLPSGKSGLVSWAALNKFAAEELASLGLDFDVSQIVATFPQGVRQMTEIARILYSGAEVIMLDEPTSALSAAERIGLFDLILTLKEQGKAIVYISHFLEEVLDISDRVTILKDGRKVNTYSCADLDKETIIRLMTRKFIKTTSTARQIQQVDRSRNPLLSCNALSHRGSFDDVTFDLFFGEAVGLYGNVGSGTTALAETLFGLRKLDSGWFVFDGQRYQNISHDKATRIGMRFIPEERRNAVWLGQKVSRNVALAGYTSMGGWLVSEGREAHTAEQVIEAMDIIPTNPQMLIEWFSGGNQQKAIVGRCIVETPKLMIICEPANGMDVGAKASIIEKIWDIKAKGVAILIVSTDPEVIVETCDRAIVMKRGSIKAELQAELVTKEGLVSHG